MAESTLKNTLSNTIEDLPNYIDDKALDPRELALVHVTKYPPIWKDDHFEIQSRAEATDYLYPRNTIHFTVGHHVTSHMWGNWDASPIMVVAPMNAVIDSNEKPLGMSSVDTYFETSPGRNLVLPPQTHIFMPADNLADLGGKLSKTKNNKTIYKASGFTSKEKKKIFEDGLKIKQGSFLSGMEQEYVTKDNYTQESDCFFALQLKKNMLSNFISKAGYLTEEEFHFSSDSSTGAKGVCALGEHLGCRFPCTGGRGHYYCGFEDETVSDLYKILTHSDFILNFNKYSITGDNHNDDCPMYYFTKNQKEKIAIYDSNNYEIERVIGYLKRKTDWSAELNELEENAGKKRNDSTKEWTSAYRETFHIWKEKTLKRLSEYYKQADKQAERGDLDAWQKNLDKKIASYEDSKKVKANAKKALPLSMLQDKSR